MSWIQNEISREHQAKSYRDMEHEIPLFLRHEAKDPQTYYYDWLKMASLEIEKLSYNSFERGNIC